MAFQETKIKDIPWDEWRKSANKLSKDELIQFLLKKSSRAKREQGKKIDIEKREKVCIDSYISLLSSIIPTSYADEDFHDQDKGKKGVRLFEQNEGRKKQIKVLEDEIKAVKKKIEDIKKPKAECQAKKKEAQNSITQKKVKAIYRYFEKDSDEIIIQLFETFIGCLRGVEKASKEDVEIYLKKHKGLLVSMNKLDEAKINREHAKKYADSMKELKATILEKQYIKFVPFYVWMDNVIRIIKLGIEEKHLREDLDLKADAIFKLNHEIDRTQIILDHYGIGPDEHEHMQNVVEFWKSHMSSLQEHLSKQEDKFNNWEDNYIQELQDFKHNEDDDGKKNAKKDYPKPGDAPKGHAVKDDDHQGSESGDASENSNDEDDEENEENEENEGDEEESNE